MTGFDEVTAALDVLRRRVDGPEWDMQADEVRRLIDDYGDSRYSEGRADGYGQGYDDGCSWASDFS
jgi:hypothetical protein